MKRKRIDGNEQDAFSRRSRTLLRWRPGQLAALKRRANQRERREAKTALQRGEDL